MRIPLATEAYERRRAFTPEQTLVNFIVEIDDSNSGQRDPREQPGSPHVMLLQRPGLTLAATLPSAIRGLLSPNSTTLNATFAVAGNQLYRVQNGTSTALGGVTGGPGLVSMAANFDRIAIVCYPNFYLYGASHGNSANTFRSVPIPDLFGTGALKAVAVTMLNGYFVVACEDGTFLWLEPGQDQFDALNFATAESSPDGLTGVTTLNGNLVLFGTTTVENWQVTGNADLPFQRTAGQDYARGCLHRDTIENLDNSVIWVGEDGKVYRANNTPQRISTDGIDERLKLRTGDPSAWSFAYDGHLFYVLTIPGQGTFAYDVASKVWSEFKSDAYTKWLPQVGCFTSAGWLCGSSETGAIWTVSDSATDAGVAFTRSVSATATIKSKPQRADNLALDVGCSAPCSWQIRWADADESLAAKEFITLGATRAGSDVLTYYRMGAAREPWRTIEVRVTEPVVVRISGLRVGEAYR